jgi:UDP-N-acetylmuramate dehydrogenase
MDLKGFVARIGPLLGPADLKAEVPLAPFTTFGVGGRADLLARVRSVGMLRDVLAAATQHAVPVTVLGGGSNVLVADGGVRGVVIRLQLTEISQPVSDRIRAEAGVTINGLVRWTISRGLAAVERWAGTPGTVGGAIYGNAHWARQNIGDLITMVQVVTPEGALVDVASADMGFAYDTSRLQRTGEIAVWAEIRCEPGVSHDLRARARESLAFRKRTQPLALPSAGCVFQNPDPERDRVPADIPASAGALVDRAGLKGRRRGGAEISDVHANFIVNRGGATAADIRALIEDARNAVKNAFDVELRDEVVFLGTF